MSAENYIVVAVAVSEGLNALERKVNQKMREGYGPQGGVISFVHKGTVDVPMLAQAMTLRTLTLKLGAMSEEQSREFATLFKEMILHPGNSNIVPSTHTIPGDSHD